MCLQMVVTRGVEVMERVLGWDRTRTAKLLQDCQAELGRRLQQVQAAQSIRGDGQQSAENPENLEKREERPDEGSN